MRTILTLTTGAAAGAGAMYLLDPEAGRARRRELRRDALTRARHQAAEVARSGAELGREVADAALQSYQHARADATGMPSGV